MYNNVQVLVTFFLAYNVSIDWPEELKISYIYGGTSKVGWGTVYWQSSAEENFRKSPFNIDIVCEKTFAGSQILRSYDNL